MTRPAGEQPYERVLNDVVEGANALGNLVLVIMGFVAWLFVVTWICMRGVPYALFWYIAIGVSVGIMLARHWPAEWRRRDGADLEARWRARRGY